MKKLILLFALAGTLAFSPLCLAQTTVALSPLALPQFLNNNGQPCSGCKLSTFSAGTTSNLVTYSESTGTTPNTNPIIMDSSGRPSNGSANVEIFLTSASYKFKMTDANNVQLWVVDNITWATPLSTFSGINSTGDITIQQPTAATSGANQSSFSLKLQGKYWNGSASATDQWQFQNVLGSGSNPSSTLSITHSGSSGTTTVNFSPALVFNNTNLTNPNLSGTVTNTGNNTATAGQNVINSYKFNNIIYVDGVKYPVTQTGIQAAFTDACALNGGVRGGTTVYLPLGNVAVSNASGQQFLVTCPITIVGPGPSLLWFIVANTVPNTVPFMRFKPAAADQGWYQVKGGFRLTSGGAFGGDAFFLDSTNAGVNHFRLENTEIDGLDNAAWCVNMTAGITDQFFFGNIVNNSFNCGIKMNTSSTADSWLIEHNSFGAVAGNTLPCIDASVEVGASHITAFNNNGGCAGGFFISHGTTQCKILYNQIEQPIASTEANSAIIDLIGDTYAIDGCEIVGNNINAHTFATRNIRLGTASNTSIYDNVISVKATTGIGIDLDAGAATLTRMPFNEFTGTGGGAVAIKNSFNVTNFATRGPDGTAGAPTYSFANNTDRGWYNAGSLLTLSYAGLDIMAVNGGGPFLGSAMVYGWSSNTDPVAAGADTSVTRKAAGVAGVGNGTAGNLSGIWKSGNLVQVASDFTTAASTSLQTITGLSWTLPAVALNHSFHCELAYSQATAAVSDAFGIQVATNAPTNVFATGRILTNATGTNADGVLATLSTTTATNIVTFTPSATGANFVAELSGTIELPASANTINIMVSTSAGADAVTVKRGSYCELF